MDLHQLYRVFHTLASDGILHVPMCFVSSFLGTAVIKRYQSDYLDNRNGGLEREEVISWSSDECSFQSHRPRLLKLDEWLCK